MLLETALAALITLSPASEQYPEKFPVELGMVAQGTGFFINSQGYIGTAAHVIEGAKDIKVYYQGALRDATLVAVNYDKDVAILKLINITNTPYFKFDEYYEGLKIAIAGYPSISNFGFYVHITTGVITVFNVDDDVFEMQAKSCHGNSGGPIIDKSGDAVGVLTLGYTDQETDGGLCSTHTGGRPIQYVIDLANKASVKYTESERSFLDPWFSRETPEESAYKANGYSKIVFIQVTIDS